MRWLSLALLVACASQTEESNPEATSGSEVSTPQEAPQEAPPQETAAAAEPFACHGDGFSSSVSRTHYDARHGLGATRFSELTTAHEKPLEECGLEAVLRRLAELKCDDGTNPYQGDLSAAHRSRAGNVGPGGRCGSIIDLYRATCPEGSYDVYADMYFCPSDAR
ncbi:MAG: hypothetical protein AAGE52_18580 [Myxococcota bacterium]